MLSQKDGSLLSSSLPLQYSAINGITSSNHAFNFPAGLTQRLEFQMSKKHQELDRLASEMSRMQEDDIDDEQQESTRNNNKSNETKENLFSQSSVSQNVHLHPSQQERSQFSHSQSISITNSNTQSSNSSCFSGSVISSGSSCNNNNNNNNSRSNRSNTIDINRPNNNPYGSMKPATRVPTSKQLIQPEIHFVPEDTLERQLTTFSLSHSHMDNVSLGHSLTAKVQHNTIPIPNYNYNLTTTAMTQHSQFASQVNQQQSDHSYQPTQFTQFFLTTNPTEPHDVTSSIIAPNLAKEFPQISEQFQHDENPFNYNVSEQIQQQQQQQQQKQQQYQQQQQQQYQKQKQQQQQQQQLQEQTIHKQEQQLNEQKQPQKSMNQQIKVYGNQQSNRPPLLMNRVRSASQPSLYDSLQFRIVQPALSQFASEEIRESKQLRQNQNQPKLLLSSEHPQSARNHCDKFHQMNSVDRQQQQVPPPQPPNQQLMNLMKQSNQNLQPIKFKLQLKVTPAAVSATSHTTREHQLQTEECHQHIESVLRLPNHHEQLQQSYKLNRIPYDEGKQDSEQQQTCLTKRKYSSSQSSQSNQDKRSHSDKENRLSPSNNMHDHSQSSQFNLNRQTIYERNMNLLRSKQVREQEMRDKLALKENNKYSFTPAITSVAQNMVRTRTDLMMWEEKRTAKQTELRQLKMDMEQHPNQYLTKRIAQQQYLKSQKSLIGNQFAQTIKSNGTAQVSQQAQYVQQTAVQQRLTGRGSQQSQQQSSLMSQSSTGTKSKSRTTQQQQQGERRNTPLRNSIETRITHQNQYQSDSDEPIVTQYGVLIPSNHHRASLGFGSKSSAYSSAAMSDDQQHQSSRNPTSSQMQSNQKGIQFSIRR